MRFPPAAQILTFVFFALLPSVAQGQQSLVPGTWTIDREQSDDVNARINKTLEQLNVIARQVARPRIRRTNTVFPRLVIDFDQQNVRLEMEGSPPLTGPANGQSVLWHRLTGAKCAEVLGECVRATMAWENGALKQTLVAENGERVNVFTVSPDGRTLNLNVILSSTHLKTPLTYRLVYNRAS